MARSRRNRKGETGTFLGLPVIEDECLKAILGYWHKNREFPSVRKVAALTGHATETTHRAISKLAAKRYIRKGKESGQIVWAGATPEERPS